MQVRTHDYCRQAVTVVVTQRQLCTGWGVAVNAADQKFCLYKVSSLECGEAGEKKNNRQVNAKLVG